MKARAKEWMRAAFAATILGWWASGPAQAQGGSAELEQALALFEQGEWERAIARLQELEEEGGLSQADLSRSRKYMALGHILLGQGEQAVEAFKRLVRQDADFGMTDLGLGGQEPPPEAVRYFGQAILEVRQEEIRAREAQLIKTSRKGALLRAAVVPGWGHYYQGYRGRGFMTLGLAVGSMAFAGWAEATFRKARDEYEQAGIGDDFEKLHKTYKDRADRANLAFGVVGAIWVLNVLEAVAQGPNIARSPGGLALHSMDEGQGVRLVYRREF